MFEFDLPAKADRTAYYYLQKANAKHNKSACILSWITRVIFLVLAGIELIQTVRLCRYPFPDAKIIALTVFSALLGLLTLLYAIFYFRLQAWRGARFADRNGSSCGHMTFTEQQIEMSGKEGISTHSSYDAVQCIFYRDGYYFLFVSCNRAIIVPMAYLTSGGAEHFPAFITEKTGHSIEAF